MAAVGTHLVLQRRVGVLVLPSRSGRSSGLRCRRCGCGCRRCGCGCRRSRRSCGSRLTSRLSGTLLSSSVSCAYSSSLKYTHEPVDVVVTSKANFTITCRHTVWSAYWLTSRKRGHGAGRRLYFAIGLGDGDRTDYQSWRVGSKVDIKRQRGGCAGHEQNTVGNHLENSTSVDG